MLLLFSCLALPAADHFFESSCLRWWYPNGNKITPSMKSTKISCWFPCKDFLPQAWFYIRVYMTTLLQKERSKLHFSWGNWASPYMLYTDIHKHIQTETYKSIQYIFTKCLLTKALLNFEWYHWHLTSWPSLPPKWGFLPKKPQWHLFKKPHWKQKPRAASLIKDQPKNCPGFIQKCRGSFHERTSLCIWAQQAETSPERHCF